VSESATFPQTLQTLYFSDRPVRIAGDLTMPAYMDEWKAGAGPDDFASDPPNATLSVYEPGSKENKLIVVEITHPVVDGKDPTFPGRHGENRLKRCSGTAVFSPIGENLPPGDEGAGPGEMIGARHPWPHATGRCRSHCGRWGPAIHARPRRGGVVEPWHS